MSDSEPTFKLIEIVGTSRESVSAAIDNAVAKAAETLDDLDWFQVSDVRGRVSGGKVAQYQVVLKAGFRLR